MAFRKRVRRVRGLMGRRHDWSPFPAFAITMVSCFVWVGAGWCQENASSSSEASEEVSVASPGSAEVSGEAGDAAPERFNPEADEPMHFLRIHVPSGGKEGLPDDGRRYVPMPLATFNAAVDRLRQKRETPSNVNRDSLETDGRSPSRSIDQLDHVLYDATWADTGLRGSLSFSMTASTGGSPPIVPLDGYRVDSVFVESEQGTGAASRAAAGDGSSGIVAREAGRYRCSWRLPFDRPAGSGGHGHGSLLIPIVPAIASTFSLQVPQDLHATMVVREEETTTSADEGKRWVGARLLDVTSERDGVRRYTWLFGAVQAARLQITRRSAPVHRLFVRNELKIARRQVDLHAEIIPRDAWTGAEFSVEMDKRVDPSSIEVDCREGDGSESCRADWRSEEWSESHCPVTIRPPDHIVGTREPIHLACLAFLERGDTPETVPLVTVEPSVWGGGLIGVTLDEFSTFTTIETDAAVVLPTADRRGSGPRLDVEQQSSTGTVRLALGARQPSVEVSCVTNVDLSPASVTARAAAALRVSKGEVFEVSGRVGTGWFIDAVEVEAAFGPVDWRLERDGTGGVLRVSMAAGLAAGDETRLRVVGHRSPLPFGRPIGGGSLDMVRFDGEVAGEAFVDLRADAETTVLVSGPESLSTSSDWLSERMRSLCELQPPRARLPGGVSGQQQITILRRRPPVDVSTSIRATVRDDRISESFTFNCSPRGTELDSIVVHFSETTDDTLDWAVLAPSAARASARRAESDERRTSATVVAGAESWVVDLQPAVRGPVTVRATRSLELDERHRVPLAWVEGAPSRAGEIVVRDSGRTPPRLLTGGLPELPDVDAVDRGAGGIASFMFDVDRDLRDGRAPLEIESGHVDSADARAWVWSEQTVTWCHASGAIEHETVLDIENHGRLSIALNHPSGARLRGVSLDDIRLPASTSESLGGGMRLTLPAGRRFVRLVVRLFENPPTADSGTVPTGRPQWNRASGRWELRNLLGRLGFVNVSAPSGLVDLPVLQRSWSVLLSPGLETSGWHSGGIRREPDWMRRLLGCSLRFDPDSMKENRLLADQVLGIGDPAGIDAGFQKVDVTTLGQGNVSSIVVMRRDDLWRFTLAAGVLGLLGAWRSLRGPGSPWGSRIMVLLPLSAVAALWCPVPWFAVPRAFLWGLGLPLLAHAAGLLPSVRAHDRARVQHNPSVDSHVRGSESDAGGTPRRRSIFWGALKQMMAIGIGLATSFSHAWAFAQPADVEKVFILEEREGMALVPESLFRRLAWETSVDAPSGPVLIGCRLIAIVDDTASVEASGVPPDWRCEFAIDGEGVFTLEMPSNHGRFVPGSARLDGALMNDAVERSGRHLRLVVEDGGSHVVSVAISPEVSILKDPVSDGPNQGMVTRGVVHLPRMSSLSLSVEPRGVGIQSEKAMRSNVIAMIAPTGDGPWRSAGILTQEPATLVGCSAVSLAWVSGDGRSLLCQPDEIDCVEELLWKERSCELSVVISPRCRAAPTEPESRPAPSAVNRLMWPLIELSIDPILELSNVGDPISDSEGRPVRVARIAPDRVSIEWLRPVSGQPSVTIPLAMPLESPVGVFDVPGAWPVGHGRGRREIRLNTAESLRASVDLAAGSVGLAAAGPVGFDEAAAWIPSDESARDVLTVSRRRTVPSVSQRLALSVTTASTDVSLDAKVEGGVEATSGLVVTLPSDAVVEKVTLTSIAVAAGGLPDQSVDVAVNRRDPTRLTICPQRPPTGRMQLRVDLHVPPTGSEWANVPLVSLEGESEVPTTLTWTVPEQSRIEFDRDVARDEESFILPAGVPTPRFRVVPARTAITDVTALPNVGNRPGDRLEGAEMETQGEGIASDEIASSGTGHDMTSPSRVELADVRMAVDGRGRAWGVVRFELVPADDAPVLRFPRGLRLFGAFVDESPRRIRPVDASGWTLDLLDSTRPRTVTAVFAGDLGTGLAAGDTVEIEPPRIDGLPTRQVAWTLRGPSGRGLRPVEPSAGVSAQSIAIARTESLERLTADVIRAFEGRTPDEQMRIRSSFERTSPDPASPEVAWDRSSSSLESGFHVLDSIDPQSWPMQAEVRPLRFRAPAAAAPHAATRAFVTLLVVFVAAAFSRLAGLVSHRPTMDRWCRVGVAICVALLASAWSLLLTPAWPGLVICALLALSAITGLLRGWGESRWKITPA